MNSCLFLLVVVLVLDAASAELDRCWDEKKLNASLDTAVKSYAQKLVSLCRKEKPDSGNSGIAKCVQDKIGAALVGCKEIKLTMEFALCLDKRMGITTAILHDFKKYKTLILYPILDDKRKIAEDAMNPCEKEKYYVDCVDTNLAKVCLEAKLNLESTEEIRKQIDQFLGKRS